jgi:hypothetical protein
MFSQNCGLLNNGLIAERGNCLFLLRDAAGCKNKIQINPGFYSDSECCGAEQYHGDGFGRGRKTGDDCEPRRRNADLLDPELLPRNNILINSGPRHREIPEARSAVGQNRKG